MISPLSTNSPLTDDDDATKPRIAADSRQHSHPPHFSIYVLWLELVVIKYLEIRGVTKLSRKKKLSGLDWTGSHVNTEGRTAATATNMAALVGWGRDGGEISVQIWCWMD